MANIQKLNKKRAERAREKFGATSKDWNARGPYLAEKEMGKEGVKANLKIQPK